MNKFQSPATIQSYGNDDQPIQSKGAYDLDHTEASFYEFEDDLAEK